MGTPTFLPAQVAFRMGVKFGSFNQKSKNLNGALRTWVDASDILIIFGE